MRRMRIALPIALLVLAACTGGEPTTPPAPTKTANKKSQAPKGASPSPASAAPSPTTPSASPGASASPSPEVMASPVVAASVPPAVLSAVARRRADLDAKLALLAQSSFSAAATSLLQAGASDAGNPRINGTGVVANNGGSLLSDHGGGLISNNGGGLISDGGGGLVSKTKFALLQAAVPTISDVASATESLRGPIIWRDGTSMGLYKDMAPKSTLGRTVFRDAAGQPVGELAYTKLVQGDGVATIFVEQTLLIGPAREFGFHVLSEAALDLTTGLARSEGGDARFLDPASGVEIVFDRYDVDYVKAEGVYKRRIEPYGLVEEGRFAVTPDRGLFFPFEDPLKRSPGEYKTKDKAGTDVYRCTQTREDGDHVLVQRFDFLNGFELVFRNDDRLAEQPAGTVLLDGAEVGQAGRAFTATGGVNFTVALVDDPATPIVAKIDAAPRPEASAASGFDTLAVVAGSVQGLRAFADGAGQAARLDSPLHIVAADARTAYVADLGNNRVRVLTRAADTGPFAVATLVGGTEGGADGPAATAGISRPYGVALWTTAKPNDTLLLTEGFGTGDARIRAIRLDDPAHPVTTIAGGKLGYADGEGTAAAFNKPDGLCVGDDGVVYIADEDNACIRTLRRDGAGKIQVGTLAGKAGEKAHVDGDAAATRFMKPTDLAWDAKTKTLWVVERDAGWVRALDLSKPGEVTSRTVSGPNKGDLADGPLADAGIGVPVGVVVDAKGNVVVADYAAKRLRMITPAGQVRTLVGRDLGGAQEGPARLTTIQMPWGVDVLPNGDVIFASNGLSNVAVFKRDGAGD